jgi:hypothetical protein
MRSQFANEQLDGYHRPCRPEKEPPDPEKVARSVPGGRKQVLVVTWTGVFALMVYEPFEPVIVTTDSEP